jgi:hypothetical protein
LFWATVALVFSRRTSVMPTVEIAWVVVLVVVVLVLGTVVVTGPVRAEALSMPAV